MKYIYPSIVVLIVSVGLSFFLFSQRDAEQERQVENEENIKAIYSLLAVQSSHMRTIMNMNVSRSHWQTHKGRTAQIECEECLGIYKKIREQVKEIEKEVGFEDPHNKSLLERLGAEPREVEEGGEKNANEPGGSE